MPGGCSVGYQSQRALSAATRNNHPIGAPAVVTHNAPQDTTKWPHTTFVNGVSEGIAGARGIADEKDVTIANTDIARQALDLGLVYEVCVSLVPVLLGWASRISST